MPWLQPSSLAALVAAPANATAILVAHSGERRQPLLGLYPSDRRHRASILAATAAGERGLQRWIATVGCQELNLPPETLRNANRPAEAAPLWGGTPGTKEQP
jgi:molybdopterin-guanine dinucleotide biosynthesis protein A